MATPSLAMVPSGYKDGTLYSVLPNNAGGDFDVTRGSLATRVNKNGLIEPVGTLGADVVLNGDFEETGADQVLNGDFSQEGVEQVTNGDFATDSDWHTNISEWVISGGVASTVGTAKDPIYQDCLVNGTNKVTFTLISGELSVYTNYPSFTPKETFTVAGTYTVYLESDGVLNRLYFYNRAAGIPASIDNVSVVEVGQDWTTSEGVSIGSSSVVFSSAASVTSVRQPIVATTSGKTFKVEYEILSLSQGAFNVTMNGAINQGTNASTIGIHTDYIVAPTLTTTTFGIHAVGTTTGSITNITVEEVGQEWVLTDGCSITAQGARILSDGTNQQIAQSNVLVVGDTYEIEYEITESVSGSLQLPSNFNNIILKNTVGVHKLYAVAQNSTTLIIKRTSGVTDVTIDNIKLKRLNGDDTPRIDYTDGGCPVLLTEPQSTNLITNSNDFSVSSWIETGVTSTLSATELSPSGNDYATLLFGDVTTASTKRTRSSHSTTLLTAHSFSVYVKADSRNYIQLVNSGDSQGYANFDIANGIVGTLGSKSTSKITSLSNGWFRCELTTDATTVNSQFMIYLADNNISNFASTSNGTEGVYIWGAQLEELSYSTSYIPTYGAVRTRLQDSVFGAGTSSDFNSVEGVLFAEISLVDLDETNGISLSTSPPTVNRLFISLKSSNNQIRGYAASDLGSSDLSVTTYDTTSTLKVAVRYSPTEFSLWVNGVKEGTTTFNAFSEDLANLSLNRNGVTENYFFGKTSQVQVFKTALTDAELLTLTTI